MELLLHLKLSERAEIQ